MVEPDAESLLPPQDVIERLREALVDADGYLAVETAFRRLVPEGEQERHRAIVFAFGYMLVHEPERREEEGPFAPAIVTDRGQFPPPLSDIETVDIAAWRRAAEQLDDPIALSRLHDLLWERRDGVRPDLDARAAVDAYIAVSRDGDWHAVERVDCITRALELARAVNDAERQEVVVAAAIDLICEDLASEDGGPGVSLTLLATLAKLDSPPEQFDELLDSADQHYGDDPYIADTVADLRIWRSPDLREELRRQQVEKWRAEAVERGGIEKTVFLRRALEIATTYGFADLVNGLRVELQEIGPEEFDLKTISAELQIPTGTIQSLIDSIVAEDWEQSLARFGQVSPPGGDPEELDRRIEELRNAAPLQFLVRRVVVGPEETTLFEAGDDESHLRLARAEQRAQFARIWALIAVEVLAAIPERHGMPTRAQLTELFTTNLIDPERAERFARGVELYLDGQPDEAAHVLVPRIEATVRELARRLGIPIIREPTGNNPGHVQSLGRILGELGPHFVEHAAWHAYLENLLTDELGLNLRNVISHGLSDQIDRPNAALLIQAACYLRLLGTATRDRAC